MNPTPAVCLSDHVLTGERVLTEPEARALSGVLDLEPLLEAAAAVRDRGHGDLVTYSRNVFVPLTHLCRDICGYCTFAQPPRAGDPAFLSRDQVLRLAESGAAAGCKEALFTLGDKPELRWRAAREGLEALGCESTLEYLAETAGLVLRETGLLPHLNPGVMTAEDLEALRPVAASMGIMLESVSTRLLEKGEAHYGCPDKEPRARLETIALAGKAEIPFTSGLLIGIGETRAERIDALLALRALHQRHGHLQELIIQPFKPKPGTLMAKAPPAETAELLWTIAAARLVMGPEMSIQAPPNLTPESLPLLVRAGIDDWGGVSPLTPDHVNPEAPWPHLDRLRRATEEAGKTLAERLTIYPRFALEAERWVDPGLRPLVLDRIDGDGLARTDSWTTGSATAAIPVSLRRSPGSRPARQVAAILDRARSGDGLSEQEVVRLFAARGDEVHAVCDAADELRREVNGDEVTYVVNRNINYTNVCYFKCQFCAFSKGKFSENLRGRPYDLELDEIARRTSEAWERGATEVCLQGGIHPAYTGATYLEILGAVKRAAPEIHVHAFSPLEVWQGAATLGMPLKSYLERLRDAGLGTLPGTAAEILDDAVRAVLCPDKINTGQWLEVMETAHRVGLRSTATIMFGHVDRPVHWARHLLRVRSLQARTGGFTELVPLPFVAREAPIYLKGRARRGPTFREALLMHAIARLVLHPLVPNIQASWVKLGADGAAACLQAGVNDLGGTLMNESITRAAGAEHGQEMPPATIEELVLSLGRRPRQRTTLYDEPAAERRRASFVAAPLAPLESSLARRQRPAGPLKRSRAEA